MKIRTAELVSGSEQPVGEGITAPMRAVLRIDGQMVNGIVKTMPIEKITAECLCAILLRSWGAPVPEPVIVAGEPIRFASVDVGYPNLKQKIGFIDQLSEAEKRALVKFGGDLLSQHESTPLVIAADEAIGNRDRNLGNILWDGNQVAYIDHERSLGLENDPDCNKLALLVAGASNLNAIQASAVALALTLSIDVMNNIDSSHVDVSVHSAYLSDRITKLAGKVLSRFPQPQDLLTGLN